MQSRCTLIAAAHGRAGTTQRSLRRAALTRRITTHNHSCYSMLWSYYPGHMRASGSSYRRRYFHSSQNARDTRGLHTSSPLSSQALSTLQDDDDDDYVARIANSHLSELLREDMHDMHDEYHDWPSLDDELGVTSIWDMPLEEDEQAEERLKRPQSQAPKRSGAEMLSQFDPQCPPQSDNLEDLQLWLECQAQRESVLKYQNVIDSARDRRDYASLGVVQKQIVHWYPILREKIEEEQKAYMTKSKVKKDMNRYGPFLCTLQPQKLAVIVAHESIMHTLQKGANGVTLSSLAIKIGSSVEAEVNVQRALLKRLEESSQRITDSELNQEGWVDGSDEDSVSPADTMSLPHTPDEGDDETVDHFDNWMYGPSHLQRFIEEAHSLEPSKKSRIRIDYANRRARWILKSEEEWSKSDKLKLGVLLIEVLLENATISRNGQEEKAFSHEKRYLAQDKWTGRVYLHDTLYKMAVEDSWESLEGNTTRYKPMVLPPRDWVAPDDGGYSWLKVDLMRTHGSKLQKVRQ